MEKYELMRLADEHGRDQLLLRVFFGHEGVQYDDDSMIQKNSHILNERKPTTKSNNSPSKENYSTVCE